MQEFDNIVDTYRRINGSYDKSLVFHAGLDAGFFCEYGNMIMMMLYCLENKITFKMYSTDANFGCDKGWEDYFIPFCEEVYDSFHHRYNRHPSSSWKNTLKLCHKAKNFAALKWKLKSDFLVLRSRKYYRTNDFNFLTHDLLSKMAIKNRFYNIPEININGGYIQAYNRLFDLTWRFNDFTKKEIEKLITILNLPKNYISCQIRGGDKNIEFDLLSTDLYAKRLRKISNIKDVFVLTDDYRILNNLSTLLPEYNLYTLCRQEENGYFNQSFSKMESSEKRTRMIRFFASMEILYRSDLFLGTITATPSIVMIMRKFSDSCIIDFEKDDFENSIDYTMEKKRILSQKYLSNISNE